ncbi:hypothetical protein D9756_008970 [Leucocoprinus leucothites]|uniref:Nephrocystin 3-like N-terminal domain-containing protein n=1 Tax=Leucocoprinus leucothites TaxID=201217 RepID=A0A8H5CX40_9AGAR|nr:hypothetical protein D9756_008970 [Leucoagaricus leucothites]
MSTSNPNILFDAIHDSPSQWATNSTHTVLSDEKSLQGMLQGQCDGLYELLWVHGPAGVGKTSITHSLAQKLIRGPTTSTFMSTPDYLGSSLSFSSRNGITDHRKLFPTLAHRLAASSQVLARHIRSAFQANPQALHLSLKDQCEKLIVQPIRAWAPSAIGQQDILMLIDGLEQCDGGEMTQIEIIQVIHKVFSSLTIDNIRWRWVISSRPEAWLHTTFLSLPSSRIKIIPISLATAKETEEYILAAVDTRRTRSNISLRAYASPSTRINARAMENLRWHSGGHLGYLASLFAYINDPDANDGVRLREVTSHVEYASFKHNRTNMFSQLDAMYHDILSHVSLLSHETTKRVLGAISLMQPSNSNETTPDATTVASLLGLTLQELYEALYHLHSVVNSPVQGANGSLTDPELKFHHKSFDAFLRNNTRSHNWAIDVAAAHADLAKCCMKHINAGSGRNRNQAALAYATKRWFIHCWRTDMGGEDSADTAFALLPQLYDMDFRNLPPVVDRYFVEWLLRVQELTMSEYLVLNSGPGYAPEEPVPWSYNTQYSPDWSQLAVYSRPRASIFDHERGVRMRRLPARPTYILGIEPEKQILLVPMFEEKDWRRQDVNFNVIGPKEKCWDLIRGFRATVLSDELREEIYSGGGSANVRTQFTPNTDALLGQDPATEEAGILGGSDYDELVARSLAWAEENGESEYDRLLAQSLAWEEENARYFEEQQIEPELAVSARTPFGSANGGDDIGDFPGLLTALAASRITEQADYVVNKTLKEREIAETAASENDLSYHDRESDALWREQSLNAGAEGPTRINAIPEGTDTGLLALSQSLLQDADRDGPGEGGTRTNDVSDNDGGSDSGSGIIVVGQGEWSEDRHGSNNSDGGESFELIERDEALSR